MNQAALHVDTILNNRYKVIRAIGQGGFGITYLAHHIELNKNVAIKECFVQQWCVRDNNFVCAFENRKARFEEYKIKFLKEAQTLAKLDHKNIVKVTDYFEENGTAYFVMEYVGGESLLKVIERMGKLDEDYAIRIIIKLSEAVDFLHQRKILHRDIKPDNIIIDAHEEPILLDFGAARELAGTLVPHTVIQTPGYAPIEQYDENSSKGSYIDIYSIGATLYHLVTGQRPISAQFRITEDKLKKPKTLNPSLSDNTCEVILKAMSVMHYNRYQSVQEFVSALKTEASDVSFNLDVLTSDQKSAFQEIEIFLNNKEKRIFILSGVSNTGKSFLVKHLISYLQSQKKASTLLANVSRVAESLRLQNQYQKVTSLYTLIYNFNDEAPINKSGEEIISEVDDEENIEKVMYGYKTNHDEPTNVYIVDNAELVSDEYTEFELLIFGTGKLLRDLIEYSDIKSSQNTRKIIFVGDDKQLIKGNKDLSSLSTQYLKEAYLFESEQFELKEIISVPDLILAYKNILSLYTSIKNRVYNHLLLEFNDENFIKVDQSEFKSHYSSLPTRDTIILEHTNKQAKSVNENVRKLFGRTQYLEIDDRIVLHNNIEAIDDFNQTFHFANGEFAQIVEILDKETEQIIRKGKHKSDTTLTFRKVKLKFETTDKEVEVYIIENFFLSDDRGLSLEEEIALRILVNKKFGKLTNQEKIDILRTIALAKGITDLSEYESNLFLDKKEFNKFLNSKKILKDIRKYFFRKSPYLNAAKIRFGYCITCYRAQGFKWKNVIVNCENNGKKTNSSYFRWLYTALTRSSSKLFLINPPTINAFMYLKLSENINVTISENVEIRIIPENFINFDTLSLQNDFTEDNLALLAFYKIVLERMEKRSYRVTKVEHNNYQECYHIEINNSIRKLRFSYDRKFHIKRPIVTDPLDIELIGIIFSVNEILNFPKTYLKDLYLLLKCKLNEKSIDVFSVEHDEYADTYTLVRNEEVLTTKIHYDGEHFFTTVIIQKTNSEGLLNDFKEIIETKML